MTQNHFRDQNPYLSPRPDVIRAELAEQPRPKGKPRNSVIAGTLLLLSLPFAAFIGRMWLTLLSRLRAGDTSIIDTAPAGALAIVAIVSLIVFGGIPVCLHEIVQAIRRR